MECLGCVQLFHGINNALINIFRHETFSTFEIVSLENYLVKGNGYFLYLLIHIIKLLLQNISLLKNKQINKGRGWKRDD
jgi:hypothetical protein